MTTELAHTEPKRYWRFRQDMDTAGYAVEEYRGRNYYQGPAIQYEGYDLQNVIRATTVRLQTDQLGKSGLIVYPA